MWSTIASANHWRLRISPVLVAAPFIVGLHTGYSPHALAQEASNLEVSPENSTDELSTSEAAVAILKSRCGACHGPEESEGQFRTDSREFLLRGGDAGPAVIPGSPQDSHLVALIRSADKDQQMPPKDPLLPRQIELIEAWIAEGAEWPESMPRSNSQENPIVQLFAGQRLDLWSLQSPNPQRWIDHGRPKLEEMSAVIDQLVHQQLSEAGLSPSPPADPWTLLRRLSFDLTGLPPDAELVAKFQNDPSEEHYRSIVDAMLSSADYGRHQATAWLDLVRYADTEGYERDEFRPNIWRYRDYVVHSFNEDKPFNQFVLEQLAGDEHFVEANATTETIQALIATGYLRLGQWDSTAAIFQEEDRLRAEMLADLTNTTASAFLGLTFSCCQCHDHKYDPFSQVDHYRLSAFFSTMRPRNDLNLGLSDEYGEVVLSATADTTDESTPVRLLYQGNFRSPREVIAPGFVSVLAPEPAVIASTESGSSGYRTALAQWITSPDNPWTPRVLVNRVWQQHFGVGLVSTPNDFGFSGSQPSNLLLLDTLAVALVEDGWSIKNLHRAIVLSKTYRQRSDNFDAPASAMIAGLDDIASNTAKGLQADPENRLLWRQNARRLSAESLRDAMLSVSGLLQAKNGGPPVWPMVPDELLQAQPAILEALEGKDDGRKQGWYTDPVEATDVRSIYLIRKRCLPVPMLQVFDQPDSTISCARRDQTIVAPQALTMLNSDFTARVVESMASRLLTETGKEEMAFTRGSDSPTQQIASIARLGFQIALQRPPDDEETTLSQAFLSKHYQIHLDMAHSPDIALHDATVDFCRAIVNFNAFLYID